MRVCVDLGVYYSCRYTAGNIDRGEGAIQRIYLTRANNCLDAQQLWLCCGKGESNRADLAEIDMPTSAPVLSGSVHSRPLWVQSETRERRSKGPDNRPAA